MNFIEVKITFRKSMFKKHEFLYFQWFFGIKYGIKNDFSYFPMFGPNTKEIFWKFGVVKLWSTIWILYITDEKWVGGKKLIILY